VATATTAAAAAAGGAAGFKFGFQQLVGRAAAANRLQAHGSNVIGAAAAAVLAQVKQAAGLSNTQQTAQ
jgi:hypothetical protein